MWWQTEVNIWSIPKFSFSWWWRCKFYSITQVLACHFWLEHNVQPFCDALTMVKTTNYGELMTGPGCFEVSVHIGFSFLHNLVLGKFWTEINVTDAKVPTPSGFLLPCQFPLKTGSEHLATAFITFIWKSETILWKYYQPSQDGHEANANLFVPQHQKKKKAKKMHFTVWQ